MSSQKLPKHSRKVAETRERFARIIAGTPISRDDTARSEVQTSEVHETTSRDIQEGLKIYNIILLYFINLLFIAF